MTMIEVMEGITKRNEGEELIEKLDKIVGSSFYNIRFGLVPARGSFTLIAESDYEFEDEYGYPVEDYEKELHRIINHLLVSAIYLNKGGY